MGSRRNRGGYPACWNNHSATMMWSPRILWMPRRSTGLDGWEKAQWSSQSRCSMDVRKSNSSASSRESRWSDHHTKTDGLCGSLGLLRIGPAAEKLRGQLTRIAWWPLLLQSLPIDELVQWITAETPRFYKGWSYLGCARVTHVGTRPHNNKRDIT